MSELPENKIRIFYDYEASHYRIIADDLDLSDRIVVGGIKVDFEPTKDDMSPPIVTLTLGAWGGLKVTLKDGTRIDEPAVGDRRVSA